MVLAEMSALAFSVAEMSYIHKEHTNVHINSYGKTLPGLIWAVCLNYFM